MKANNLMPGDLVKSFGNIEEVFMVDASSEDEKDQLINYRSASEFEPIKLTPDILRKNGFKEVRDDGELIFIYILSPHPICKGYSACTIIPNNVKPDWLEGINKINELREKMIKENPRLDPRYERKDSQN